MNLQLIVGIVLLLFGSGGFLLWWFRDNLTSKVKEWPPEKKCPKDFILYIEAVKKWTDTKCSSDLIIEAASSGKSPVEAALSFIQLEKDKISE